LLAFQEPETCTRGTLNHVISDTSPPLGSQAGLLMLRAAPSKHRPTDTDLHTQRYPLLCELFVTWVHGHIPVKINRN